MEEEAVTLAIVGFLKSRRWVIVSFDYPQSGAGICLLPNKRKKNSKNLGKITPDIIAKKNSKYVFLENKVKYRESDIDKIVKIKQGCYSENLSCIFGKLEKKNIFVGIGFEYSKSDIEKASKRFKDIDCAFCVNNDNVVTVVYKKMNFLKK